MVRFQLSLKKVVTEIDGDKFVITPALKHEHDDEKKQTIV